MGKETYFKNGRISNSERLMALTSYRVIWHTTVYHSLTSA